MVQPDSAAARYGANSGFLAELDENGIAALRAKRRDVAFPLENAKAKDPLVILDRSIETRDLQSHTTESRRVGQTKA
jgi:hypothetical protein